MSALYAAVVSQFVREHQRWLVGEAALHRRTGRASVRRSVGAVLIGIGIRLAPEARSLCLETSR